MNEYNDRMMVLLTEPELISTMEPGDVIQTVTNCDQSMLLEYTDYVNHCMTTPLHVFSRLYGSSHCSKTRTNCFHILHHLLETQPKKHLRSINVYGDTFMHEYTKSTDVYTISYSFLGIVSIVVGDSIMNHPNNNNETPFWNLVNVLSNTPFDTDTKHVNTLETCLTMLVKSITKTNQNNFFLQITQIHNNFLKNLIKHDYYQLVNVLLDQHTIMRDFNVYLKHLSKTKLIQFVMSMSKNMLQCVFDHVDHKLYNYYFYSPHVFNNHPAALYAAIRDNDTDYINHLLSNDCFKLLNVVVNDQTIFHLNSSKTIRQKLIDKCQQYIDSGHVLNPLVFSMFEEQRMILNMDAIHDSDITQFTEWEPEMTDTAADATLVPQRVSNPRHIRQRTDSWNNSITHSHFDELTEYEQLQLLQMSEDSDFSGI
jgi:hypothetical protein